MIRKRHNRFASNGSTVSQQCSCEGAKRDSIYEYLKFRRKAMFFRRNLSQSVETISVTSNFDGYSEVNQLKKDRQHFGDLS